MADYKKGSLPHRISEFVKMRCNYGHICKCSVCGVSGDIKEYYIPRAPNIETRCEEHKPDYPDTIESVMRELAVFAGDGGWVENVLQDGTYSATVFVYPEDGEPECIVEVYDFDTPLAALQEARDRLVIKEPDLCFCRETGSTRRDCVEANMCLGHRIGESDGN